MKVVFFSSVLNHHQLPLCIELNKILGDDFIFVSTMEMEQQRINLGYEDMADKYSFCLKMHASKENYAKAYQLSQDCDILIAGVIPLKFIDDRLKKNKITFRYSERIFGQGFYRIFTPKALKIAFDNHFRYRNKPFYLLCASGYLSWDMSRIFSYKGKKFKWGYFPEFVEQDLLKSNKPDKIVSILWVGRFLELKQPNVAIEIANYLFKKGFNFKLQMIGVGPVLESCISMVKDFNLSERVDFLGALSPEKVREKMLSSDIFLFTSNHQEGWGVVLNEAMNSGCAIFTNKSIGSVPFLIKDGFNGIVYEDNQLDTLFEKLEKVINDYDYRVMLSTNAYCTIKTLWNPNIAATRLIRLFDHLLNKNEIFFYDDGPLSKAEVIK